MDFDIDIRMLGYPRIIFNGDTVKIPYKQAEAIFYYLVIEGETSRDTLADIIWESAESIEKNRANVRNTVYILRRIFGKSILCSEQKKCFKHQP